MKTKMKRLARLLSTALVMVGVVLMTAMVLAPNAAQAQDEGVKYADKTVIDFNDVTLEGELTKPEGAYLLDRKKSKFKSLIRLRDDFLSELQTSVDNL